MQKTKVRITLKIKDIDSSDVHIIKCVKCVICNDIIYEDSQFINGKWYHNKCIEKQLQEINKLTRENNIRKAYFEMIKDIGYDYDGYSKPENLMILIDELVELARDGLDANDKKIHYTDTHGKTYNILMEEVNNE